MKTLINLFLALASAVVLSPGLAAGEGERRNPNVIFILTDDLGYSDIGCYGATKVKTPNIDRLASEGMRFTSFYTAASICSPSRAAFLTGAYPQRCGLYMGINPNRKAHWFLGLNPEEITLAEQFKSKGYDTCMVGKWHLGSEPEFSPLKQGFDSYHGMPCNFQHSPEFYDGETITFSKTPLDQLTTLYTDRVGKFIRQQGDKPFFLYYAHNYPHTPYKAGKAFAGSSKDGVRGDIMQEMDWGIGEMMKALEETGVADNTLIIFTSDNGPTKNQYALPYRGTKYVTFEGGHRVPFILHWPSKVELGKVNDEQIQAMDLFPTLSEVIGASMPEDRVYDGVSLVPLLHGKPLARSIDEPFYYYNCENLQAVRKGEWKLHLPRKKEQLPFWDRNKSFLNVSEPALYQMSADPGESVDVSAANPGIVQELESIAKKARMELGEYLEPGTGQRATGTVIADAPVISTEKDWGMVDPDMEAKISRERKKRYPNLKTKGKRKGK